jgi:hypothetical protein
MFTFTPDEKMRSFKGSDFVGKTVTVKLQHKQNGQQYVGVRDPIFRDCGIYGVSGWVKELGDENTEITREIKAIWLMESMNGGRRDYRRYDSYWSYFNDNKKKEVFAYWSGGMMGKLMRGGGNPDRANIVAVFDDFEVDDHCGDFDAPEEWYSELHKDKPQFKFERGFYKDAAEAVMFFKDRPHDDLFGERYFPVVVFPKDTEVDVRMIVNAAKSCSQPIMTDQYLIFGTRCKSYEYAGVIEDTYKNGGQIARAMDWDWDG